MFYHKNTKTVNVGGIKLGGGNRIAVQSMLNTPSYDIKSSV